MLMATVAAGSGRCLPFGSQLVCELVDALEVQLGQVGPLSQLCPDHDYVC